MGAAASRKPSRPMLTALAFVLVLGVVCGGGTYYFYRLVLGQFGGDARNRAQCRDQLDRISMALSAYHADFNCYPPAWLADAQGKPAHSWRVLLLPYLQEDDLYKEYRFDEPWDGPHNRRLASRMPTVYGCPSNPGLFYGKTHYLAVVGPRSTWPAPATLAQGQLARPGSAFWLVEVDEPGIVWTEPRDLAGGEWVDGVNVDGNRGISSLHPGGANVLYADGAVEFLSDAELPEVTAAGWIAERLPPPVPSGSPSPAASPPAANP